MVDALQELISLMVGGVSSLASGIGEGVNQFVADAFLVVENGTVTGLSTMGGVVGLFAGVSLAVGLTTGIMAWIQSLGN